MHILFLSNYFPPEVNAPANRLSEHARHWVEEGHTVDVLTSVPNFPEGEVYDGYENELTIEDREGVRVTRVPMYVSPNEGVLRRTLCYVSFMISACWFARKLPRPDVLVATSPQFFAALAGYWVSLCKGVPFVLEIRDIWPESVVAVGAMSRNAIIRFFEWLERFLYRQSDRIVVVTDAFKRNIVEKGTPPEKISVVKNGIELDIWDRRLDEERLCELTRSHGLEGKFVASYIGTIGMAHGVETIFEAARLCDDPDIVFMVVGTGARREELEALQREHQLENFRLVEKVPRDTVPYLLTISDVSIVHLRDSPLFETVIPSKIFEAMATRTPIVLGVRGETRSIVEEAEGGIAIPPEDPREMVQAVRRLKRNPETHARMSENAYRHVRTHYDREVLAREYADTLRAVVG